MNKELCLLIKNNLQYLKEKHPKKFITYTIDKYNNTILDQTQFLNDNIIKKHERIYCVINLINKIPICKQCNKNVKFENFRIGYGIYCSKKCVTLNNGRYALPFEIIRKKCDKKHDYFYEYDESTYINTSIKMRIICPIHGEFWQIINNHKNGAGCPECGNIAMKLKQTFSIEQTKTQFEKQHNNDYFYFWDTYTNSNTDMKIKCNICNHIFYQPPIEHKSGNGCPVCRYIKIADKLILPYKEQIKAFNLANVGEDKFIFFESTYISNEKNMTMQCRKCNCIFERKPGNHKSGQECPRCKKSKGVCSIINILDSYNINYDLEYRFNDCRNINPLPFDFYLPEQNICIEYDGEHHYQPIYGKESLTGCESRDKIKTEYCQNNNIQLIRIPYWERENIKLIIDEMVVATRT